MCKACLAILAPSCTSKRHILEHPIPLSFESRSGSAIARKCGRSTCSTRYPALLCRLCLSGLDSTLKQLKRFNKVIHMPGTSLVDRPKRFQLRSTWDILRHLETSWDLLTPFSRSVFLPRNRSAHCCCGHFWRTPHLSCWAHVTHHFCSLLALDLRINWKWLLHVATKQRKRPWYPQHSTAMLQWTSGCTKATKIAGSPGSPSSPGSPAKGLFRHLAHCKKLDS